MCQINLMHRVVKYRAEFHKYQEILPCTIPPSALNLSDTPNLIAYMQIRKCHFFYSVCDLQRPEYSLGRKSDNMANLTYIISRDQNVPSCQVPVDKTLIGEILHTRCNLLTKQQQCLLVCAWFLGFTRCVCAMCIHIPVMFNHILRSLNYL